MRVNKLILEKLISGIMDNFSVKDKIHTLIDLFKYDELMSKRLRLEKNTLKNFLGSNPDKLKYDRYVSYSIERLTKDIKDCWLNTYRLGRIEPRDEQDLYKFLSAEFKKFVLNEGFDYFYEESIVE